VFGATYSSWCSAAPESFPLEAGRLLFNSNYNGTELIIQLTHIHVCKTKESIHMKNKAIICQIMTIPN
jgi:hypothetical protein